ncbi:MAG: hypothetical protein ACU837_11885 [Gammaproteobacteria bacterium]
MKNNIAILALCTLLSLPFATSAQEFPQPALNTSKAAVDISVNESDELSTAVIVSLLIGGIYLLYWIKAGASLGDNEN